MNLNINGDTILSFLTNLMNNLKKSINKQLVLYADTADCKSPTAITGPLQQPDIVIVDINKL